MATTPKQRVQSMDILKLFAIFLVIYGHSLQHLLSIPSTEQPMFRFLHSFHMPLFMAISGFFAVSLQKLSIKEFFVKKGRQLLVPAIVTSFLVIAIGFVIGHEEEYEYYVFGMWFLKSLFLCSLLYFVATSFRQYRLFAFLCTLLISQLIPYLNLPTMYPPFLLGAFMRNQWPWFKKNSKSLIGISGIVFIVLLLSLDESDFVAVPFLSSVKQMLNGDSSQIAQLASARYFRIAIGLAGTLFFMLLFESVVGRITAKGKSVDFLSKYGQRTLGVYVLQTFVLEVLMARTLNFDSVNNYVFTFIIAPALSMIVLIVTLWLVSLCEKNKITSLIFLGK